MQLLPQNQSFDITGEDLVRVLREIELAVVSLHKIGSHYSSEGTDGFEAEMTRFIAEWKVTQRLANARALLSAKFDAELGPDHMDDLERAMQSVPYWEGPGCRPPE